MVSKNMSKKFALGLFFSIAFTVVLIGVVVVIIDPYFHYHKPISGLIYPLSIERYQNDGIEKHFDYDAIIIGTSMIENCKTSQFDMLFDLKSVKLPLAGASYKEVDENVKNAIKHNENLRIVVRSLDYNKIQCPYDYMEFPSDFYPNYLYDDNIINDVYYLLNKSVLFGCLTVVRLSLLRDYDGWDTNFDAYANWMDESIFGYEAFKSYQREEKINSLVENSIDDYMNVRETLDRNIIQTAKDNPQIDFYLFITPYSILYWDGLYRKGELNKQLELEKYAISMLVPIENIHLYSFNEEYDIICNLDNYRDACHYAENINEYIIECIYSGKHEITKENYNEYCQRIYDFYTTYDYDNLNIENLCDGNGAN